MNKKWSFFIFISAILSGIAQNSDKSINAADPTLVNFTAQEDRANMMVQLGLKTLRPGADSISIASQSNVLILLLNDLQETHQQQYFTR